MGKPSVSDETMRRRAEAIVAGLRMMGHAQPVSAIRLAARLDVGGDRENKRRRAREAVTYAREILGERICGNGLGYWLARDHTEWARYQEAVKARTVFQFVRMSRSSRAILDRFSGQGKLFETRAVGWR